MRKTFENSTSHLNAQAWLQIFLTRDNPLKLRIIIITPQNFYCNRIGEDFVIHRKFIRRGKKFRLRCLSCVGRRSMLHFTSIQRRDNFSRSYNKEGKCCLSRILTRSTRQAGSIGDLCVIASTRVGMPHQKQSFFHYPKNHYLSILENACH